MVRQDDTLEPTAAPLVFADGSEPEPAAALPLPPRPLPPWAFAAPSAPLDAFPPEAPSVEQVLDNIDAEVAATSLRATTGWLDAPRPNIEDGGSHASFPSVAAPPLVADRSMRPDLPQAALTVEAPRDYRGLAKRAARLLALGAGGWLALVLLLIVVYRFINPPASALMLQQRLFGQDIAHRWVALGDMSPNIVRAVLVSEDGRFCEHYGVDYGALRDAFVRSASGSVRGASTISMQVVKNLFLWPSKSYLRKAIELPLTYFLELVWPKRRIMEVYLNIAEWGPGIFGVGAAAAFHFNKDPRSLSEREAARLAAVLPNPKARNAARPGPGTQRIANAVQVRMRLAPTAQLACLLPKRRI